MIDEWIKNMWYGEEDGRGVQEWGAYVKKIICGIHIHARAHTHTHTHTHTPSLYTPYQTVSISYL